MACAAPEAALGFRFDFVEIAVEISNEDNEGISFRDPADFKPLLRAFNYEFHLIIDLEAGMDYRRLCGAIGRIYEDLAVYSFGLVVDDMQLPLNAENLHAKFRR